MKSTTSVAGSVQDWMKVEVLDLDGLLRRFALLKDTRSRKGRLYSLPVLLLLIVLAKLAGQDQPKGIAEWISFRGEQLREALHLTWVRMPHRSTYERVLEKVVRPGELDREVGVHLESLPGVGWSVLIAFDGKTLRGTIDPDNPQGDHLLVAYLPFEGIVLFQVDVQSKDNEIVAAPRLLKGLDLRGRVVMGDAIHTQRELSVQILDQGGDYIWYVKDNQPKSLEAIERLFAPEKPTVLGGRVPDDFSNARQVDKGHGRLEVREITVSSLLNDYLDWPGVKQVFRLQRSRRNLRTAKQEVEVVYGMTSLDNEKASAAKLLDSTRRYWGIENSLHGRRDVTFREDRTRLTRGNAGRVMASINNLVIGLLSHAGVVNFAEARRWYDAQLTLPNVLLAACSIT